MCVYVCVCKVLFSLSQTIIVAETREFESIYYVIFLLVSFCNNLGFPRDSLGKESIHITGYIGDREDAETCICSLSWEDSLEEEMATHSSILT